MIQFTVIQVFGVLGIDQDIKVIFVDECIFSPQTHLERIWSSKGANIRQLDLRHELSTEALVAGISFE